MMESKDKLRVGIIGLGKMGLSHASIVGMHNRVGELAVCDTSTFVLEAFKKFTDTKTFTDYKELITVFKPDLVFIATPTVLHYPITKLALENGIHVFCEKPFSINPSEGKELTALASRNNLVNQVGYHNHFIGTFRELSRLLEVGAIGKLTHFLGEAYGPVVTKPKGSTWRSKKNEGGGCLMDYAAHVINLIQEIIGRPVKVAGSSLPSVFSKDVEDSVYCTIWLENGLSGQLSVNWSDETYRKMSTTITVSGTNGKIICDATEIKIYLKEPVKGEPYESGWTIKSITDFALPVDFYLRGEEYSAQVDNFIAQIDGDGKRINTFEQAVYTDKVMHLISDDAEANAKGIRAQVIDSQEEVR